MIRVLNPKQKNKPRMKKNCNCHQENKRSQFREVKQSDFEEAKQFGKRFQDPLFKRLAELELEEEFFMYTNCPLVEKNRAYTWARRNCVYFVLQPTKEGLIITRIE